MKQDNNPDKNIALGRSLARLFAVQSVYSNSLLSSEDDIDSNIGSYLSSVCSDTMKGAEKINTDNTLLKRIIEGVKQENDSIEEIITANLKKDWTIKKMGELLSSILRCAIYELKFEDKAPSKVIINEYTNIAASFFGESETGFVNATLQKVGN